MKLPSVRLSPELFVFIRIAEEDLFALVEGIQDWCISRQLCGDTVYPYGIGRNDREDLDFNDPEQVHVSEGPSDPENWEQEADVDTWASSYYGRCNGVALIRMRTRRRNWITGILLPLW